MIVTAWRVTEEFDKPRSGAFISEERQHIRQGLEVALRMIPQEKAQHAREALRVDMNKTLDKYVKWEYDNGSLFISVSENDAAIERPTR